jgi:hypothetical protein
MSHRDEELPPIDLALLEAVTGGTATNEQITEALKQIKSSIDGMKTSNNNGTQWLQMLIPLLLISRTGANFSYSGGGYSIQSQGWGWNGPGYGYHWRRR